MQLDWSTLVLEIVNFLVLVWLLQRFLYKPILNVVAARQAAIDQAAQRTREMESKAHELQAQYEARLQNWEQERAQARGTLMEELRGERERALAALHESLEQERRKGEVLDQRRRAEETARSERQATEQALAFVRRLLAGLSGPELEVRLVQLAIDELQRLPALRQSALREALSTSPEPPTVCSAYPLPATQREALSNALGRVLDGPRECRFREEPALLAGVRISVGPWILQANLGEELSLFGAAAGDGR
jgi:F-type H+-transporting ATPase subunit b